jgi:3-deoxy-D-manno-octulosonic-acid transferase
VKYDFWANYLIELQSKNLKHYVIAAIFRENQYFFQKRNKWMLNILSKIDHYFVQNENSRKLLENHEINQVSVVNDTRFDRVLDIANDSKDLPLIKLFKGEKPIFIAGSTWTKGEEIIQKLIKKIDNRFKYIIAPHEINETQIAKLEEKIKSKTIRYSSATKQNISCAQVLIIDNIGLLSALYAYADIAYIGGGFGKGIHNILESATFGMPIFIGLNNAKFKEAQDLKEIGVAKEINSDKEMIRYCEYLLNNKNHWNELKIKSKQYVRQNSGATKKIMESVFSIKD